ncbi:MAG TPA: hypothetical protein PLW48_02610 [Alphaproteobacteria bacterium]|nr:hypothetical protein [Rhodospirillaceae bacterium]HRJ66002.1 hypothetical protein [Alphaproteobacteria bacterium]
MDSVFEAERISLADYALQGLANGATVELRYARGLWMPGRKPGDVSVLGRPLSFPQIFMPDETLTLVRRIAYGGFLRTDYDVDFLDAQGNVKIAAQMPAGRLSHFSLDGATYTLDQISRLSFRPLLMRGDMHVARFRETTPFLSFSSRKTYQLQAQTDVPPLALAAAFFISVMKFY